MNRVATAPVKTLSREPGAASVGTQLLAAFSGAIQPVRVGLGYRVGLLVVAATMLLLVLIYIGMIGLVLAGLYWYVISASVIFESKRPGAMLVISYLAPIAAGIVVVLFMIKPLFARRPQRLFPLTLERGEQPVLFAFVDRLCEVVGAPRPSRIDVNTDVNASASFREGLIGFLKKDLVLTIGLPLVAGLNLRQFSGVLAHEFGHFAQGTAMRLTYLIRSISGWFWRVVYERDAWDEWLIRSYHNCQNIYLAIPLGVTRLFVWLTRWVLWALMWVGHAVSVMMLRQMEYDADRYEARVAGSKSFEETCERMAMLNVAAQAAFSDLDGAWRERRLCDDLPALIHSRESEMPLELRDAVRKFAGDMRTGWFDTHPSNADRLASVQRERAPGVFAIDAPASILFHDFQALCHRATSAFYNQQLGGAVRREQLVTTASLVQERSRKREDFQALRRCFQDMLHPLHPVFLPGAQTVPGEPDAAAEMLLDLRSRLLEIAQDGRAALTDFLGADERLIAVTTIRAAREAGQRVDPKEFRMDKADEIELSAVQQASVRRRDAASKTLNKVLRVAALRVQVALSLEQSQTRKQAQPEPAMAKMEYDLADAPGRGDKLLDALAVLKSAGSMIEALRRQFYVLGTLLAHCRDEKTPQTLINHVINSSKRTLVQLQRVYDALRTAKYPYEHADKQVTIAFYVIPTMPAEDDIGAIYGASDSALDAVYGLYMRIMADLSRCVEQVEEELGLSALPDPPETTEDDANKKPS